MATYAGRYDEVLLRKAGNRLAPPVANTTVLVYESDGSTTATLYTDRTKATTAANPVSVDASGNLEFFAEPGTYVLSIRESGSQVATNTVTVLNDPAESTGGGATNLTWTASTSTVASDTGTDAVLTAVDATNPGLMTVAQSNKLAGIETAATADQTAGEILTAIKTVDGSGSGLDADLLDGQEASAFQAADSDLTTIAAANNGTILANTTASFTTADETKLDGIEAGATADQTAAEILTAIKTVDGTGSGLDADLLDGSEASVFALASGQYDVNTVAASGATETLPATYSAHRVTMDANCTFTFTSPTKTGHTFLLWLFGSFTPTFPASVRWNAATAPTYATQSLYGFTTLNGGTTWAGTLIASGLTA